jgi:dethiobiotin synthetase
VTRVLVVSGTGTGVGKTVVTAAIAALAIARGDRVAVVKPAQTGSAAGEIPDTEAVRRLTGLADTHELATFPDPLSPEAAARVAGLSTDHFVEVFRSAVGCTPHQYLVRCRLRHAQHLIASEGHRRSLAEIAWAAGFADQAHLTRVVRAHVGQTPKALRRALRTAGYMSTPMSSTRTEWVSAPTAR